MNKLILSALFALAVSGYATEQKKSTVKKLPVKEQVKKNINLTPNILVFIKLIVIFMERQKLIS